MDARRRAIAAVEALPVHDQELAALRAVCLEAHRGLLEAEVEQSAVRAALDGLERERDPSGTPGERPSPSQDQLGALQGKMQRATAVLKTAQAALTACESRSREATLRYR